MRSIYKICSVEDWAHAERVDQFIGSEVDRRDDFIHFSTREQVRPLVELGPRGTGKSYAYQELSPYTILLTGPTIVANLFYNMASGKMGLVGIWDAIGFDEVADLQKMPKEGKK